MPRKNRRPPHTPFTFTASSCRTKRRFPTEKQARQAADTQELQQAHICLSVYRCDQCNGWHLTRQTHS